MEAALKLEQCVQQCLIWLSTSQCDEKQTEEAQGVVQRLQSLSQEITNYMTSQQVAMTGADTNEKLQQEIEEMTTELATKKRLMKSLDEMVIWWQNELECLSREQNQLQDIISVNTAE
ncbi:uncharacterized protein LOC134197236 [Corticium candelabrum]|uniref:uncharacterized protein LOC134197236 n=1 Tax=Corticium candelabrum TaxID=121492 RepID=UPI002E257592|nr:uncharacterized protein LOC134197236 [Corticium candelabrum]